jgi:hypothetical protein
MPSVKKILNKNLMFEFVANPRCIRLGGLEKLGSESKLVRQC